MSSTKTITTYKFEELSERAKEKVRSWWIAIDDVTSSNLHQMFIQRLFEAGYPTNDVQFSLGHCQGDGVAFYTSDRPVNLKDGVWDLRDVTYSQGHVDPGKLWRRIARKLSTADRETFRALKREYSADLNFSVNINKNSYGHVYSHARTMEVEVYIDGCRYVPPNVWDHAGVLASAIEDAITEDIRALSAELEQEGYDEIEYQRSDEALIEALSEHDFDEQGRSV